jgi:hypothetical protein
MPKPVSANVHKAHTKILANAFHVLTRTPTPVLALPLLNAMKDTSLVVLPAQPAKIIVIFVIQLQVA